MNRIHQVSNPKINFRRLFIVGGLLSLSLIYAVQWVRMITNPAERTGADFIAFYAAGRITLTGHLSDVYVPQVQQAEEESVLGFSIEATDLNPFVHPPFILPFLALVALLPYVAAFHVWALFMLVLYGVSAWLLVRTIPPLKKDRTLLISIILFFPAFVSILNGQNSAILFLGAALWLCGLVNNDDRLAGIGLALTTIRPHIAILLAVPFIFRRRKVWWWFAGTATGLVAFSVALVGLRGTENYLHMLIISASGEGYKINEFAMVNFIGLFRRLAPGIPSASSRLIGWIVYACALVLLCAVWIRSKGIDERQIGLAVLVAILAVPHLHYHDLVLLIVPLVCTISVLKQGTWLPERDELLLPLIVSVVLLFSFFSDFLLHNIPYLIILLLFLAIWFPEMIFRKNLLMSNNKTD
jgi:hypothetical protein